MREYKHADILGNDIKVGDACAYPTHNELKIGIVAKLNPKMIDVVGIGKSYFTRRYPHDVYLISNDPKLSMYLLKNSK
jgi:hypothetical protein